MRWRKNLLKFVALEKPSWVAICSADRSLCASSRLASRITRRSMKSFAPTPAEVIVARERVRGEYPSILA